MRAWTLAMLCVCSGCGWNAVFVFDSPKEIPDFVDPYSVCCVVSFERGTMMQLTDEQYDAFCGWLSQVSEALCDADQVDNTRHCRDWYQELWEEGATVREAVRENDLESAGRR